MVMRIPFGVENKKGALGALDVCAWSGKLQPRISAMDVTNHGVSDDDRDGDAADSRRYEVPWRDIGT